MPREHTLVFDPEKKKSRAPAPDLSIFRGFLDAVGACVVVLSPERKILYMNAMARRTWASGGAEGQDCFRVMRQAREPCPDCPIDEVVGGDRWVKRDMRMHTREGWRTQENLYVFVRGKDPATRVIGILSTDVSGAGALDRDVARDRELSRALLESVEALVLGFDESGALEFVNRAVEETVGLATSEIFARGGVVALVPDDALDTASGYFLRPPGEPRPAEPSLIPVKTKEGARRMASWTYSPLSGPAGEMTGAIAIGQDVTERFTHRIGVEKRAEELETVNRVLAGVSAAADFEGMLEVALDALLALPGYPAGACFVLEEGASEARRVSTKGFKGRGPGEHIRGTEKLFPATAVYNRKIEVARPASPAFPVAREVMREEGLGGMVAVPVFPGGHPLGIIILGFEGERSDEDLGMGVLAAVAESLELGAENSFLRLKAEQRAREATALFSVGQHLSGTLDLEVALGEVARDAVELLSADACAILLAEGEDRLRLSVGYPEELLFSRGPITLNLKDHPVLEKVARSLEPIAIYDVGADRRVPEYIVRDYGIRSSLSVPLIADGGFLGILYCATTEARRVFDERETELMVSFAHQASIAIKNAALVRDLRESEERYRAIFENSGVGFIIHDGDNILYANERAGEIIGFKSDDFDTLSDIFALAPPADRQKMLANLKRRMNGDPAAPRDYDTRLTRSDGSTAVLQLINTPMNLGGRKVMLVAVNDVTARVEAEKAVKESEERYRTLIESSRDAIMIADPAGRILFTNTASTVLIGRSVPGLIGASIYDFVHPQDKATTLERFRREWEAGRSVARFPVRSLVDGVERYFEVTTAILGEAGPSANVMVIVSDVTERILAQRRLEESEEKYRTIVETTHDAIISVNRGGEILFANQAIEPLFGVSPGEARGRSIFEFVHPEARERALHELTRDFRTGRTAPNLAMRAMREDGTPLYVEVNSGLLGWPGDDAAEILVIRDVTERHQREKDRERQLEVEEALSSIASRFMEAADIDGAVHRSLEDLARLLGSTTFFVEISADGARIEKVLESSDGSGKLGALLETPETREYAYLYPRLSEGREVVFEDLDELPEAARTIFSERYGIESFAAMPVLVRGSLRGVLGYASVGQARTWDRQDLDVLREVEATISRALERREFVEELERSERFRARITESIGEGLFVLRNGIISWANEQMSELSGYAPAELVGSSQELMMPAPEKLVPMATQIVDGLLLAGLYSTEEKLKRKDGSFIDVQFYVTSLGVEDRAGELLVTVRDVTEEKRMREEVTEAAESYANLFSSASDALLVHMAEGAMIDVNERATLLTGYSREELLTMEMRDLVPAHLRKEYDSLREEVESGGTATFETRILHKDGTVIPAEAASRLTGVAGETVVLSSLRDISERKKAEEDTTRRALQLAALNEIVKASTSSLELHTAVEAMLRVTLGVSGAGAGVVVLRAPGGKASVVAVSKRTEQAEGLHMDQAQVGALMEWLALEHRGATHAPSLAEPGECPQVLVEVFQRSGWEELLFIPLYSGDKPIGAMGLGAVEEQAFDPRDLGFYDAVGAEAGVSIENALIYRELTAEHERLSLLYRSAQSISGELELGALLETTAAEAAKAVGARFALVGLVDEEHEYFQWGAAYNLDMRVLEKVRLPVVDGIGGIVVNTKRAFLIPKKGEEPPGVREVIAADPVLEAIGVDFGVAVPLIAGDRVVGVLGLHRGEAGSELSSDDILLLEAIGRQAGVAIQNARLYEEAKRHLSSLEKAHRELMVLDRMKSDFVSTVSHELRSPLAVIEGFAKTMVEHFDRLDRETQMESIEIILKKSIALEGLIENILDMSRIEEGRLDVNREPFDVVEMCQRVSADQERVEGLHELKVVANRSPIIVIADRDKTEVAIGNLIRNALKFSPDGGAVTVSVKEAGSMAEVAVTDEGIGITPDDLDRVFDRFYQVDSSETRSFPGSGLGLYITKELVEAMGGNVTVESEHGEGSTFTIALPKAR